jgi:hypothetical protein
MSSSTPSSSEDKKRESTSKLEKKQQIPTEYNEEQTLRAIRKQDQITGETRSKTVNDFPYVAAIAQVLKDLEFPADKEKIIKFLQQQSKNPQSREILSILQQIEEKRKYNNIADITKAARLVE